LTFPQTLNSQILSTHPVKQFTYNGNPVCAMRLANGQYMFTCGDYLGLYELAVPLDENGEITLYAFCGGMARYKHVFAPWNEK
jgi:hypothetical protein